MEQMHHEKNRGGRFLQELRGKGKVKFSHTGYRALGPELIPVYRQSAAGDVK